MSTSPQTPVGSGPTGRDRFDSFIASLRRIGIWRTDDRWFGGVAAGLAHRLGVDPLIVRAGFILAGLLGGIGLVLYGLAWLLLPEASDGRIHLQQASRGQVEAGLVGAGITIVLGLGGTPTLFGFFSGWGLFKFLAPFFTVALLVALIVVIVSHKDRFVDHKAPVNAAYPTTGPAAPTSPPSGGQPFRGGPTSNPTVASAIPTQSGPTMTGAGPSGPGPAVNAAATPSTPNAGTPPLTSPAATGWPTGTYAGSGPVPPHPPYGPPARPSTFATPPAPVPFRPVRRGAGGAVAGTVAALTLFIIAGLMLLDRYSNVLHGAFVPGLGFGAIIILAGLAIIVLGIAGRRAGGLTAFVILATVFLLPALVILHVATSVPAGLDIGNHYWAPTDVNQANRSYSVGIGQGKLDLRNLAEPTEPRNIDFQVGVGDAVLTVPNNVPVEIDATVSIGSIIGNLPDGWTVEWTDGALNSSKGEPKRNGLTFTDSGFEANSRWDTGSGGIGVSATIQSPEVVAGAEPSLTINAKNNIGRLLIQKGN